MIASQFIALQAIFQSFLYIQYPYSAKEVFICFDSNGTRNESWPSKWSRMEPYAATNAATLRYPIPTNSTVYKLKLRKGNDFTQDSDWLELYSKPPTTVNNSTNTEENHETNHFVIWYIAVCSSLLVFKSIFTSVLKCLKIGLA